MCTTAKGVLDDEDVPCKIGTHMKRDLVLYYETS